MTKALKDHIQRIAQEAGRQVIPLTLAMTKARGKSKEDLAREIAQDEGITEGLICVLFTLENCMPFGVKGNRQTQRREVVREPRKCLHYYFYLIDREFGFMHIRLQSWFLFQIQLYSNGREWIARQMDQRGIGYQRYDNSFLEVQRMAEVQRLCTRFVRRKWVRVLDQAEIATDVMFREWRTLTSLLPEILKYAVTMFSSDDVLRFLGKSSAGTSRVR